MSATTTAPRPVTLAGRATQARVIASEWTKFRSLRSTVWTLVAAVVLTVGLGALISGVTASQHVAVGPARHSDLVGVTLAGTTFAQLAIGVLGILLVSGEYATGMILSSLTAVPRRLPVLWAKIAVFVAVVLPVSLVTAFVSFLLGQALLAHGDLTVSLGDPGVLRSVVGSALYVTVAGVVAIAGGALVRHTAAAISAFVGLFFVVPPLMNLLPASWQADISPYLPSNAGGALWGQTTGPDALAPWTGFALLCGYAVVLIALAGWRLTRRDA